VKTKNKLAGGCQQAKHNNANMPMQPNKNKRVRDEKVCGSCAGHNSQHDPRIP
jgi:protein-arginine kinase activator protein McsA